MNIVIQRDIQALLTAKIASVFDSATAGGTGDNTAVLGTAIDRLAMAGVALNAEIILAFSAVLAATATLTLKTVKVQDSADGSTWADFATFTDPGVVATGPTGGGTVAGVVKFGVNLGSARRFVRVDYTPDLSASGTDTCQVLAVLNFGGFDRLPAA